MSKKVLLIFISVLILIGLIVMYRPSYLPDNDILINFEIAMNEGI